MKSGSKLRLGVVDFVNAMPLWRALEVKGRDDIELVRALPSRLVPMLESGEIGAGLLPIVSLLRGVPKRLVGEVCVSAFREVRSVLLFHTGAAQSLRRITLDGASRTSQALTQVVLSDLCETPPEYIEGKPGAHLPPAEAEGALVIGDPALANREAFAHSDLASLWADLTNLPFVFAGWLAREDAELPDSIDEKLSEALEVGLSSIPDIAAEYGPPRGIDVSVAEAYLRESIAYELGESERRGLAEFAHRAKALGIVERDLGDST